MTDTQEEKDPRSYHVGDSDYSSRSIQPWDIWQAWDLNPWDADLIKRILRVKNIPNKTKEEARIEDYEKIIHIAKYRIKKLKEVKHEVQSL